MDAVVMRAGQLQQLNRCVAVDTHKVCKPCIFPYFSLILARKIPIVLPSHWP